MKQDNMSGGLAPEQLLHWLRKEVEGHALDERAEAVFSDSMYQVPFWERCGYSDLKQFVELHPETPTPVSVFAYFLRAAVSRTLGDEYKHLSVIAFDLTRSAELHGFHAFDKHSGAQAIVVGAQLLVGLPRANVAFCTYLPTTNSANGPENTTRRHGLSKNS